MYPYRYLLFDQDGTLTDSMPGITRCVQCALRNLGIEEPDNKNLTRFIGPPLRDSFRKFYHLSDSQIEQAVTAYNECYNSAGLFENKAYTGIDHTLSTLTKLGFQLFVATSKPTGLAERILEHFKLRQWFKLVGGGEPSGPRSSKAGVIEYVLEQNNITDRSQVVMIGDRKHDILGARSAGIDSIGVLWGYGGLDELTACQATYIVKNLSELENLLITKRGFHNELLSL